MEKSILDMSNIEAKEFFMKSENYCTIDLPKYFNFTTMLKKVDEITNISNVNENDYINIKQLKLTQNPNCKIEYSKDGKYDWRKFEIIHPLLYVRLVNIITKKENWSYIIQRFKKFNSIKREKIVCCSMPVYRDEKNKKESDILNYWDKFEQESIKQKLNFEYIGITDIANCYGSIYTHSIDWAISGLRNAKENKDNKKRLGSVLDYSIQNMQYGQTMGIPQGSTLMDFIAEIVLNYLDAIIKIKLKKEKIDEYKILRYRDDYRIFTNDESIMKKVFKILTECLGMMNFKMNPKKTMISNDIITYSIKEEKMSQINYYIPKKISLQKKLLLVRQYSKKYPNARQVNIMMDSLMNDLSKNKLKFENIDNIVAILIDIMINNPNTYQMCFTLLSNILKFKDNVYKKYCVDKIVNKFKELPNSEYADIWLQRMTIKIFPSQEYRCVLCQRLYKDNIQIWDSNWVKGGKKYHFNKVFNNFIDQKNFDSMDKIIDKDEVEIFKKRSFYKY